MEPKDRQLLLLQGLSRLESFQEWRDLVCRPLLLQLEDDLKNSDQYPEPVLRGKLKHYFSEKYRFEELFGVVDAQLEQADLGEEHP